MASSTGRTSAFRSLAGGSIARFMRFVHSTSKIVSEPEGILDNLAAEHPAIIACWHGQFMMLNFLTPEGTPVKAMVARHGDAEVIGQALQQFGVELIRGAGAGERRKDRGGATALRNAVRALEDGASVVMTADNAPGPARRAGLGIVTLARLSGRPIVPVAAATSRYKSFATWSRMTVNLPFSTLAYVAGRPIRIPAHTDDATLELYRKEVEEQLNAVTERAYELAGANVAGATPASNDPSAPPAAPGFLLNTYRRATSALRPAVPLFLKLRERQGKEDVRRRAERFGQASRPRPDGPLVWVHAASVGETNAILPVIDALLAARPDLFVLLTTGTVTSAHLASRRLPPRAMHQYVPVDTARDARTFLEHWRPDLAVFTESEIWPNLVLETSARGVPLALINARMSNRSFSRWRRNPSLARPLFNRFHIVLAQNEILGRRFAALGARRVAVAGNLKIDAPAPPVDHIELARIGDALGPRFAWLAASTHEGEDRAIAGVHRRLTRHIEGLCTIIAPRHPERGTAIAELMQSLGLAVAQRSLGALPDARTDIYIADTIGELGTFYALCPIAFIGGSLVSRGGQNPIEAVRHGASVLTGPDYQNFQDIYRALLRHDGAVSIQGEEDLAATVAHLATHPADRDHMQAGAMAALSTLSGALDRTLAALLPLLESERLKVPHAQP